MRYMFFKKYTSPNFNERKGGQNPSMLILHYTGMKTAKAALEHLCDPKSEVSAHYLIEENGKTHHLVPDNKRAWHAGLSHWRGETDINSASIGIELVNPGHEFGYTEFPDKQIKSLIKLCHKLLKTYNIMPSNVLGHSDIAITRKIDPGHLFPWERLAGQSIGLWPKPNEHDYQAAEDVILDQDKLKNCLANFGYDPTKGLDETLIAFHRHFTPEKFTDWGDCPAEPDIRSCANLLSLIRQSHEIESSEGL